MTSKERSRRPPANAPDEDQVGPDDAMLDAVRRVVERAPPLNAEQVERLCGLLPAVAPTRDRHDGRPDAA